MPSFAHSTQAQLAARLRAVIRAGTPIERHRAARYIWNRGLTDNQLKALFGVTDAQLPALKTRLQNMTARIDALDAETGA